MAAPEFERAAETDASLGLTPISPLTESVRDFGLDHDVPAADVAEVAVQSAIRAARARFGAPITNLNSLPQAELVADHIKKQDIVITTALIPGRMAPKLVSAEHVASMKPGSVLVDLAVEQGGNVVGAKSGEIVEPQFLEAAPESSAILHFSRDEEAPGARRVARIIHVALVGIVEPRREHVHRPASGPFVKHPQLPPALERLHGEHRADQRGTQHIAQDDRIAGVGGQRMVRVQSLDPALAKKQQR